MHTNSELQLARQFIETTGENLFLTGKAGTGKTTFLRDLKETSCKRMIVVAPTGIAAMNAGGVTIHSFFQLSFAPHIPDTRLVSQKTFYKFSKEKINIIRSLNLLVIDEVSMVRADLLDAVDGVLRRYRDREKPFGGVQLLMIGDMQQLAPVVKEDERQLLEKYYDTNFFFSSRALNKTSYYTIELKQVYRQQDMKFLDLLNKIRTNQADDYTISELNKRYIPDFNYKDKEGYITLTTHNYQAQRINEVRLAELPGEQYSFNAKIEGEFTEYLYPIDKALHLKRGAQIMFVKNDTSGQKRYYNGKIGKVTRIDSRNIEVLGEGDTVPFLLEREKWQNTQYSLNPESKEITEKVLGSFEHYPVKLAWAITIHKSQGLTFEHAIIDANSSFAHGQVYVALSRCKTLEGMLLSSPLNKELLISDDDIEEFTNKMEASQPRQDELAVASNKYFYELVKELFDFKPIEKSLFYLTRLIDEHFYRLYPNLLEKYKVACDEFTADILKVAEKFSQQYTSMIQEIFSQEKVLDTNLNERIYSGSAYFCDKLTSIVQQLIYSTHIDTDNKDLAKRYSDTLEDLKELVRIKIFVLDASSRSFSIGEYLSAKAKASIQEQTKKAKEKKSKISKEVKVDIPGDILHPKLYRSLKLWRDAEARKTHLPVYTVIQQKAMLGITNLLPVSENELLQIPYLGKKSVEKYGDVIIDIVYQYMKEAGIKKAGMLDMG